MVKTCFVPNCKGGYRNSKQKVSLFKAPSDPKQLETWRKLIGRKDRILQPTDCVCENHFNQRCIIRHWIKRDNDNRIICKVELKQCRLAEGSFPTVFKTTDKTPKKHLGKRERVSVYDIKPKLAEKTRKNSNGIKKSAKNNEKSIANEEIVDQDEENGYERRKSQEEIGINLNNSEKKKTISKNGEKSLKSIEKSITNTKIAYELEEKDDYFDKNPLMNISLNYKSINNNWAKNFDNQRWLLSVYSTQVTKTGLAYIDKQIVISKDLSYEVYFQKKKISEENCTLDGTNLLKDLEDVVNDVDNVQVCNGGPDENEFYGESPNFAYVDESGVWRHVECTIECIPPDIRCVFCVKLESALKFHLDECKERKLEARRIRRRIRKLKGN